MTTTVSKAASASQQDRTTSTKTSTGGAIKRRRSSQQQQQHKQHQRINQSTTAKIARKNINNASTSVETVTGKATSNTMETNCLLNVEDHSSGSSTSQQDDVEVKELLAGSNKKVSQKFNPGEIGDVEKKLTTADLLFAQQQTQQQAQQKHQSQKSIDIVTTGSNSPSFSFSTTANQKVYI